MTTSQHRNRFVLSSRELWIHAFKQWYKYVQAEMPTVTDSQYLFRFCYPYYGVTVIGKKLREKTTKSLQQYTNYLYCVYVCVLCTNLIESVQCEVQCGNKVRSCTCIHCIVHESVILLYTDIYYFRVSEISITSGRAHSRSTQFSPAIVNLYQKKTCFGIMPHFFRL